MNTDFTVFTGIYLNVMPLLWSNIISIHKEKANMCVEKEIFVYSMIFALNMSALPAIPE